MSTLDLARQSKSRLLVLSIAVMFTLLGSAVPAVAQWDKYLAKSVPRTNDGRPNLTAATPRLPNGNPDLSGVWLAEPDPKGSPNRNVESIQGIVFPRYFANIAADFKPEDVPIRPEAQKVLTQRLENRGKDSPVAHCKPSGVPAIDTIPLPYKIVQTPTLVLILYEENNVFRQIFLDGHHTVADPEPRWMGYSTGKWEGDTFVVDTTGFNDQSWLDGMGHPHSEALHVTERFRRRDAGHLDVEVTIEDPNTYTKPIVYTQPAALVADEDLLEYFCTENEKDVQQFK